MSDIRRHGNGPVLADGTRLPYARACEANGFVFVSGQLPLDASGRVVEGGIGEQTAQALRNVASVLALAGLGLADVVKTTVWLADIADFAEFNRAYAAHFAGEFPARSTTGGAQLAFGARIEIEATARVPG